MKFKTLVIASATLFALSFTSCKKTSSTADDSSSTTAQATADQSTSDNFADDAHNAMTESVSSSDLGDAIRPGGINPQSPTSCASYTVSGTTYPKTITITFNNCTGHWGFFTRNGIITVVLSEPLMNAGATATMTFNNYTVTTMGGNSHQIEGTHIWTNNAQFIPGVTTSRSWTRQVINGKVTNLVTGRYWLHSGVRNVIQDLVANSFTVLAGSNHQVTNAMGITHYDTVLTNLVRNYATCPWIHSGSIKFTGPRHTAVLDFGYNPTGATCDNDATYSIDGGTPIPFQLR